VEDLHFECNVFFEQAEDDGGNLWVERRDVTLGEAGGKAPRSDRPVGFLSALTRRFQCWVNAGALGGGSGVGRVLGVGHSGCCGCC
jgi:hypothetical protein